MSRDEHVRNYRRGCADAGCGSTANTAFYVVKYTVFSTDKEEARASQCFFSPFMFVLYMLHKEFSVTHWYAIIELQSTVLFTEQTLTSSLSLFTG